MTNRLQTLVTNVAYKFQWLRAPAPYMPASAIEALGMTLPYSSSIPAEDPLKRDECFMAGKAMKHLLSIDLKPRDIMTRAAFENSMVGDCC